MYTIINMPKGNRRRAVIYVSTGLARLPRDVMSAHCYRRNYNPCFIQPLFGGRLLFLDRPQVGKPTWGYDYTTVLRRLPSPSDCHRHRPQKTAEERLYMLARGWLAYPVTPAHAQLPPKCGCIKTPTLDSAKTSEARHHCRASILLRHHWQNSAT